jgi:chromosome segregation ATPase
MSLLDNEIRAWTEKYERLRSMVSNELGLDHETRNLKELLASSQSALRDTIAQLDQAQHDRDMWRAAASAANERAHGLEGELAQAKRDYAGLVNVTNDVSRRFDAVRGLIEAANAYVVSTEGEISGD